jgi:hypothetical protein
LILLILFIMWELRAGSCTHYIRLSDICQPVLSPSYGTMEGLGFKVSRSA